jgi:TRAP-type mannitol/chloroaromatic compound transport system permease large subunit
MEEIFRGVVPFIFVYLIAIGLIVAFPEIGLFLPRTMR